MSFRIGILGVGGIGGVIGAYMAQQGRDLTLIDTWPENVERIKNDGLTLKSVEGEFTVEANVLHLGEVARVRPEFDAVILAVKSYDTPWATMFIKPYLAQSGYVVSAQNSINEDAIAPIVGWSKVVGCVIQMGAAMYSPGYAERTTARDSRKAFTLGEPSGLITRRVERLAEVMGDVGQTDTTTNLWGYRWSKLANNAMSNALAGITGLGSAGVKQNPMTLDLGIKIAGELCEVAGALGIQVEPMWGVSPEKFLAARTNPAACSEVEAKLQEGATVLLEGRPSLAQDIGKGRRTEVDSLNGYVVAKGKELGVATPINEAVVRLTKRVEAGELEPSLLVLDSLDV